MTRRWVQGAYLGHNRLAICCRHCGREGDVAVRVIGLEATDKLRPPRGRSLCRQLHISELKLQPLPRVRRLREGLQWSAGGSKLLALGVKVGGYVWISGSTWLLGFGLKPASLRLLPNFPGLFAPPNLTLRLPRISTGRAARNHWKAHQDTMAYGAPTPRVRHRGSFFPECYRT